MATVYLPSGGHGMEGTRVRRRWTRNAPNHEQPWLGNVRPWLSRHPWLHAFGYGVGIVLLLLFWAWLDQIAGRSSGPLSDQIGSDLVIGVFLVLVMRYLDVARAYALLHPWAGAGVAGLAIFILFLVVGELPGPAGSAAAAPWLALGIGLFTFLIVGWLFSHGSGSGGREDQS